VFIGAAGYLLQLAMIGFTEKQVMEAGFGTLNPNSILTLIYDNTVGHQNLLILENVLIANSPQLILSVRASCRPYITSS
jgi:hypothetical protein